MRYFILLLLLTIASTAYAAPLQDGMVDDNHPALSYTGTWLDGMFVDAYGGAYQSTTDDTAVLSFETFATGVTIFFVYDPLGDDIDVCVDGDCIQASTLGAAAIGSVELSNLDGGTKTITVAKVTNDVSVFNFDALYIHPAGSEVNMQEVEFEYDGQSYTGVLDMRLTSGDAILALLMVVIVMLQLFQVILGLWKQ